MGGLRRAVLVAFDRILDLGFSVLCPEERFEQVFDDATHTPLVGLSIGLQAVVGPARDTDTASCLLSVHLLHLGYAT